MLTAKAHNAALFPTDPAPFVLELVWLQRSKRCKARRVHKHITKLIQWKQCAWKEQFDLISLSAAFRTNTTSVLSFWLALEQSYRCVAHGNFCGHAGKYSTHMWGDTSRKSLGRFPLCLGETRVNRHQELNQVTLTGKCWHEGDISTSVVLWSSSQRQNAGDGDGDRDGNSDEDGDGDEDGSMHCAAEGEVTIPARASA